MLTLALTLLVGSSIPAQAAGGSPFDRYDANQDGKVSRAEVPERLRERFDAIDADKDGVLTAEEQRAYLVGQQRPGGGSTKPPAVSVDRDIPYAGTKNPRQTLDLYWPGAPKGVKPLPVVVFVHGGAWQGGDKSEGARFLGELASSGEYAAVSVGYRLSGEATWPAQVHDVKAALRWVRANAAKYRLDPDRIGLIGPSAGGHLVAMLGTTGDVEALEGDLGPTPRLVGKVRCVVDEFGPSNLLTMGDFPSSVEHNPASSPESRLIGGAIQENKDRARAASPITYVSKDDPPFLIIHGDKDPIVPFNQSETLAQALKDAGVDATLLKVEGGGHGGFANPEIRRRTRLFLDKHLLDRNVGAISAEPIPHREGEGKR